MELKGKNRYQFDISLMWLPLVIFACVVNITLCSFLPIPGMVLAIVSWLITGIWARDKEIWKRVKIIIGLIILGYIGVLTLTFIVGGGVILVGIVIFWIALIVYAVRIREEVAEKIKIARGYRRSATKNKSRADKAVELLQESRKGKEGKQNIKLRQDEVMQSINSSKVEKKNFVDIEKVDVNKCSEIEIMTLPGMSLLSAKRAVEEREQNGEYESFDEFVFRNGIKPHFMMQMKDIVLITKNDETKHSGNPKRGRTLDL